MSLPATYLFILLCIIGASFFLFIILLLPFGFFYFFGLVPFSKGMF
jgi:hypothetical protein